MENTKLERIVINPNVLHGKPCIRGLHYFVTNVLEYAAQFLRVKRLAVVAG
jgi:uncharacterized protein (DUF433 family)